VTWDDLKTLAGQGFEFSSHTITHARLAVLDDVNLDYELEKSRQDILDHLGPRHAFTVECPYGTEDGRVIDHALARYQAARNRMPEPFLDELDRGSDRDPAVSAKEYVQWQRGALTKTPMSLMKSWVDKAAGRDNIWLVLVFHGVDGVGWEPKTGAELGEFFGYVKSKEDRLWVATFQDVTKYMRERMRGAVRATLTGQAIEVSVAHSLPRDIYDLPVTLKTYVPADWPAVKMEQGSRVERLPVVRDDKGNYVLYRAEPNEEPVKLSKGGE